MDQTGAAYGAPQTSSSWEGAGCPSLKNPTTAFGPFALTVWPLKPGQYKACTGHTGTTSIKHAPAVPAGPRLNHAPAHRPHTGPTSIKHAPAVPAGPRLNHAPAHRLHTGPTSIKHAPASALQSNV